MFISMNWIAEYVDLSDYDRQARLDLIHRFSLSTAEVENDIALKGSELSGVVVAEIKSVEAHPSSAKLHLLKVDCGGDAPVDVVCGAPNVRVGMKTCFAKVGAHVAGLDIAPRPLAGQMSFGMCCSEKELGISDDNSGIMEVDPSVPNGTDIKELWPIEDIVFEVDNKSLTNRPDLWGHYGIAREFSALTGRPLKPLTLADLSVYDALPALDLKIEDPRCLRYSCLAVEGITKNVSPVAIRIRLYYCGMRAINLLADLTNYLMLEVGQPMHAFDSRKVESIRIRRFDAAALRRAGAGHVVGHNHVQALAFQLLLGVFSQVFRLGGKAHQGLPRLFLRLSRAVSRLWFIGRMKTRLPAVAGNVGKRGGNKESRLQFGSGCNCVFLWGYFPGCEGPHQAYPRAMLLSSAGFSTVLIWEPRPSLR